MFTGQQIFDMTMRITGENEGKETTATEAYEARALPIFNMLITELYAISDTTNTVSDAKPYPVPLSDLSETIPLDDVLCNVLPYGLAAQLYISEDNTKASYYQQRYEELRNLYTVHKPCIKTPITNVYGRWS